MKTLYMLGLCFTFSLTCLGQTKLISFKSHSGNETNFRSAVEQNLFDIGDSNFGLRTKHFDKVDTVLRKGSGRIIVLIQSYNVVVQMRSNRRYNTSYYKDTLRKDQYPQIFSAQNVDTLRSEIHKIYKNKYKDVILDSTLFIGFDRLSKQREKLLKK